MSEQAFKIARTTDRKIFELFKEYCHEFQITSVEVNIIPGINLGSINLQNTENHAINDIIKDNSEFISSMSIGVDGNLRIIYLRGGRESPKSHIYDTIEIHINNNTHNKYIKHTTKLIELIITPRQTPLAENSQDPIQNHLFAIHQATLDRLEHLNEDLIKKTSDFRAVLESKFLEKEIELGKAFEQRTEQLQSDISDQQAKIQAQEKDLQQRLGAIDDRDNTHVRREIRNRMLDDVKERINQFGVSKATEEKRKPVLAGIYTLLSFLALSIGWTALEIKSSESAKSVAVTIPSASTPASTPLKLTETTSITAETNTTSTALYLLWLRLSVLSLGFAGTILYYIRWQNKWAEQHANSEFQLQQFYIDVNRANWVLESCLEWKKETASDIPPELLTSITNGLFVNNAAEVERVIHPADELASALLGSASKLTLKSGENQLEFNKPGKIPKQVSTSGSTESEKK